jgi:hypothetical protein
MKILNLKKKIYVTITDDSNSNTPKTYVITGLAHTNNSIPLLGELKLVGFDVSGFKREVVELDLSSLIEPSDLDIEIEVTREKLYKFYDENQEELEASWQEHVYDERLYTPELSAHLDKIFWEYIETQYINSQKGLK